MGCIGGIVCLHLAYDLECCCAVFPNFKSERAQSRHKTCRLMHILAICLLYAILRQLGLSSSWRFGGRWGRGRTADAPCEVIPCRSSAACRKYVCPGAEVGLLYLEGELIFCQCGASTGDAGPLVLQVNRVGVVLLKSAVREKNGGAHAPRLCLGQNCCIQCLCK